MKNSFLSLILFIFICLSISCDDANRPDYTKTEYNYYHKICLENVMYWINGNSFSPVFNIDGSLEICEESEEDYNEI